MSLQFIMGPSGAGKSHYLYQWVTTESLKNPDKNYIVLVPEQFTMQTQKDLCLASPNKGTLNVEVLSFNRLANRVFEEVGNNRRIALDDVGKNFVIRKIAGDKEEQLKLLGSNLKKTGYISEIKSIISEFTQYDITPDSLEELLQKAESNPNMYYKLRDIQLVYEGFVEYLKEKYITVEEILDVLASVVIKSKLLQKSIIVLDGFTGFTPVQNKLIRELLKVSEKVMVTVTMDKRENPYVYQHPYQLFALSKKMVTGLMEIAKTSGIITSAAKMIRPLISFIFPQLPKNHPAAEHISLNFIANFLGLNWGATPAGLKAMEELAKLESERGNPPDIASDEMCTFLIINISSLQLIPLNMIAYRQQYGSVNPSAIIGPAILATLINTMAAIIFCKIMQKKNRKF